MTRPINLLASTRDRPTSVDRFNAGHHSGEISSERQVAASQLLQGSQTMLAVINRLHLVAVQERSQLTRVIAIIPVSIFSQVVFARIRDQHPRDMRLEQIVQP